MIENELLRFVVTAALKGSAILGVAGLVTVAWRTASAASRHLIWTLAVAWSLALPLVGAALKRLNAPQIPVAAWTPDVHLPPIGDRAEPPVITRQVITPSLPITASAGVVEVESSSQAPRSTPEPNIVNGASANDAYPNDAAPMVGAAPSNPMRLPSLGWLWLAGVVVALIPLATALIRVQRVARTARKTKNGSWQALMLSTPSIAHLADKVEILESDTAAMPMTWGFFKPTLLLPSRSERWPEWQRRDVLLHELAHVERHDCLTQLIAQIACAVYWFNPLAWVASHRMRVERELACDDRVIAAGSRASDYAANLLNVARSLRAPAFTSQTAIAMARPSQLSGRLLAVLDSNRNRRSVTRKIAVAASAAAIALALPLAVLTPGASAATLSESPRVNVNASSEVQSAPTTSAPTAAFPSFPNAIIAAAQFPSVTVTSTGGEMSFSFHENLSSPVLPPLPSAQAECWADGDGHNSVSISNSDDDPGHESYNVRYSSGSCSLEMRAEGKFTLRPDLSDLESLSNNGWFRVEERDGRTSRRVEIRRADNGSLDHQYWVNGDRTAYDENARAWLARTLLSVERRTAFAASTRVPQIYKARGLQGVVSEISQMSGAYPKAKYYSTALDMGVTLDANALNSLVRQASTDLASSDYYMSEVLGKLGSQGAANETTWRAFAEAAGKMKSDYYKSVIMKKVLSKGRLRPETVGMLLQSASSIKSDYYLSDLLKTIASQYALNADTRQYYADALRHIESDYYRSDLLGAMGSEGEWDAKTTQYVLASVADIKSDYYRSESLEKLLRGNHISDWNAFFNAAAGIESDYYKKTTLVAALRRTPLTREIVAGVLNVAPRIKSDSELSEVLATVARNYKIDDSLRPAYEKAVDAMSSDYYRGAALSALRRSETR